MCVYTVSPGIAYDYFSFHAPVLICPEVNTYPPYPIHSTFFVLNAKPFQLLKSPLNIFRWYSTNFIFLTTSLLELSDLIWFRRLPSRLVVWCSTCSISSLLSQGFSAPLSCVRVLFLLSVMFLVHYLILVKHILLSTCKKNFSPWMTENVSFYFQTSLIVWLGINFEVGDNFPSDFWKRCLRVF